MKTFLCVTLLLVSGCLSCAAQFLSGATGTSQSSSNSESELLQKLLSASPPPLLFQPGDELSVQVYGIKDYDIRQRVGTDGKINFPLVGAVQVSGLTVEQLEDKLNELLVKRGMVRAPQVTVSALERPSAVVTVSGDVGKPGMFPAYGRLTVMDYLSEAQGLKDVVQPNSPTSSPASPVITLIRRSLGSAVNIPLGPDPMNSPYARIPVFPGDEIRVAQMGMVYAVGAFKNQGAFPLKNSSPTTVFELVALAGGIGYEAEKKDAYLVRTRGGEKYVLDINLSKILKGKMTDLDLQPNDILFVPSNSMRAAIKGGAPGVIAGIASAFIYTHP